MYALYSFRMLLRTIAIYLWYLFFNRPQFEKNWLRKLRTIALPVNFMALNFDYGIQLSIIHVSKYACNFSFIGCNFARWGLEIEYPIGYASLRGNSSLWHRHADHPRNADWHFTFDTLYIQYRPIIHTIQNFWNQMQCFKGSWIQDHSQSCICSYFRLHCTCICLLQDRLQ